MKLETADSSEMFVNIQEITRRHVPEGSILQSPSHRKLEYQDNVIYL